VGDFEKKFPARPILNKKNTCANKLREKISCPIIWYRDRFDQSQKNSAGLIFRD
jgi:hypothetical protein